MGIIFKHLSAHPSIESSFNFAARKEWEMDPFTQCLESSLSQRPRWVCNYPFAWHSDEGEVKGASPLEGGHSDRRACRHVNVRTNYTQDLRI